MNHPENDIRTILRENRREALARRLFLMLFVALGVIVAAAQLRAAPSQYPLAPNPYEVPQ